MVCSGSAAGLWCLVPFPQVSPGTNDCCFCSCLCCAMLCYAVLCCAVLSVLCCAVYAMVALPHASCTTNFNGAVVEVSCTSRSCPRHGPHLSLAVLQKFAGHEASNCRCCEVACAVAIINTLQQNLPECCAQPCCTSPTVGGPFGIVATHTGVVVIASFCLAKPVCM